MMKTLTKLFLLTLILPALAGCQYLPMQEKESPPAYLVFHHPAESGGHELRGYDFARRHYF